MRGRPSTIVAVLALALAGACTGGDGGPAAREASSVDTSGVAGADRPAARPPGASDGPAINDGVANSLVLVHDVDGGTEALTAYRADGTRVATYANASDAVIWQPIWSPDGRRVAWTRSADGIEWELVTAAVDGDDTTVHPLPARPEYITYDPTASRVLALTPSPGGFGLVIVEVGTADDSDPRAVDRGQPYFSDFSPDGQRVIAHVGARIRVVGLDGEQQPLEFDSTGHQTPAWHPTDDVVFFATDDATGNRLVGHDLSTGVTTELATFDAFVLFDVDPTGARVAVSAFGAGSEDDGGLLAFGPSSRRAQPGPLDSGLWIVEVADGAATRLAVRPTAAPMWDPTGSRVLVRTSLDGVGRWVVHTVDGAETGTDDFQVGDSLLPAYLPFWDQYARSQTLWSPDGSAFVHVGRAESGESGVWIHDAATSGPSSFLAEGDLAFWSPT